VKLHGGNVYSEALALGLEAHEVLDFSASINPLGMPTLARRAIRDGLDSVLHYPDTDSRELKETIASRFEVPVKSIVVGNGSTELIYLLPRALKPKRVLITAPAFSEYERACVLAGAEVAYFKLKESDGFLPDMGNMDEFSRALRKADMAFICNPGNPSGSALSRGNVFKLVQEAKKNNCVLIVDEAFIEFCPEHSVLGATSSNLVVLRSLTKFYALAGLRVGFACMPSKIMKTVLKYKEPWSLNCLAGRAAQAALEDDSYPDRTLNYIRRERGKLIKGLRGLGIEAVRSEANYLLFKTPEARKLLSGLKERGILIRDCSNFRGLGAHHLRIAVRSAKENRALLEAMKEVMA
jgi:threonine-phosphate decarboxylase